MGAAVLYSWLRDGDAPGIYDKSGHYHGAFYQSMAQRAESRLNLMEHPNANALFMCERPRRLGEPDEPIEQP